jgi:hypothetical protein
MKNMDVTMVVNIEMDMNEHEMEVQKWIGPALSLKGLRKLEQG